LVRVNRDELSRINDQEVSMEKWECSVCGYIYDPSKGDPVGSIPAGTPFEKLPSDWVCPECGAAKDMFTKLVD
jgi:rubredoxin